MTARRTNRLARESSPYLQQHQHNPVDWYPWGEEALARARTEKKPILLSIGYSACHWCHVMEHESFENPEIARLMNENFVNIKVDREERPDLDHIYQAVAQAMTGGGGWPLTVFLTPELKPFFGGTYFPPEDKYGRPGFPRVLQALTEAYREQPEGIQQNVEKLMEEIAKDSRGRTRAPSVEGAGPLARPVLPQLEDAADLLLRSYVDWDHGGFGSAPKFPNPMVLDFLWRVSQATGHERAREAALLALTRMARGGICDHLGGGFHRYSVDERWAVPHFEKMLYDNALLLKLYAQVALVEKNGEFERIVRETTQYVLREMNSAQGGFFSTQDADSEGEEGKFFAWNLQELTEILDETEANAFALYYGVTPEGNFEHGKTVLAVTRTLDEVARSLNLEQGEVAALLSSAKAKLFAAREKRVKPGRDEKILSSWNGLMISALLWASEALQRMGDPLLAKEAQQAAVHAYRFVRQAMSQGDGRLWSVWKDGQARFNAYLDDYAFMAMAALDLSRLAENSELRTEALDHCTGWVDQVIAHFNDSGASGYYFTSDDHEALIHRPKNLTDQAIPSGSAVIVHVLSALVEIDWKGKSAQYEAELERQLAGLYALSVKNSFGFGELLCAGILDALGPVVVSGGGGAKLFSHPHVFLKPTDGQHWLVCHQRTCSLPLDSSRAVTEIQSKIRQS
jgi:uncharacterized protein YyaL (SSP411 family)